MFPRVGVEEDAVATYTVNVREEVLRAFEVEAESEEDAIRLYEAGEAEEWVSPGGEMVISSQIDFVEKQ